MNLENLLSSKSINQYLAGLKAQGVSEATIKRKAAALRRFSQWAEIELGISNNLSSPASNQLTAIDKSKAKIISAYHQLIYKNRPVPAYFAIIFATTIAVAAGIFGYEQFIKKATPQLAYPSSPTTPVRILSFQGRFTDAGGTPIDAPTSFTYKLWKTESGGTEGTCASLAGEDCLWTSTCTIDPDQDGIFAALLGDTGGGDNECGPAIPSGLFSENTGIWLEIVIGGETLEPRQPIATSAYALNAETLQGLPLGTGTSNVAYIDSNGNIGIGVTSPSIDATSSTGTFGIKGQALLLQTPSTSDGDITINPDGTGVLNLTFEGASADGGGVGGFVNATNASLTSGALYYGEVASTATDYSFIDFASGVSPTTKFSVGANGTTYIAGNLGIGTTDPATALEATGEIRATRFAFQDDTNTYIDTIADDTISLATNGNNQFVIDSNGNTGIGTTSPNNKLDVAGTIEMTGFKMTTSSSAGYALVSDGDGVGTWQDVSSSVGPWTLSGSNLYPDSTSYNVGVGTTDPGSYKLNVNGNTYLGGNLTATGTITFSGMGTGTSNSVVVSESGQLVTDEIDPRVWGSSLADYSGSSANYIPKWSDADTLTNSVIYEASGNIGIGTTNPSAKVEINAPVSTIGTNQFKLTDGTTGGYFSVSEATGGAGNYLPSFFFVSAGVNGYGGLLLGGIPSGNDVFSGDGGAIVIDGRRSNNSAITDANILNVRNYGKSLMVIDKEGNVGIGTTSPGAYKLNVAGNMYLGGNLTLVADGTVDGVDISDYSDFFIDAAGSDGQLWRSDGSGVGGWASLASGTGIGVTNVSGTVTINHADTSTQATSDNSNGVVIQDITLDDFGHATGLATVDLDDRYIQSGAISWLLAADGGTPSSIGVGDTASFVGGTGIGTTVSSGTVTINHADTSTQASEDNSDLTFIQDVTLDAMGHVSGLTNATITATNGLTATGTDIELGGTLETLTKIDLGGYDFGFFGTGNVGIGTTSPGAYKLNVAGSGYFSTNLNVGVGLTTPTFTMVTGAGDGKIFTSDASGNASWSDITSVGVGGSGTVNYLPKWTAGTTLGDSSLYETSGSLYLPGTGVWNSSGNVGIGTTDPGYKLEIVGTQYLSGDLRIAGNNRSIYYVTNSNLTFKTWDGSSNRDIMMMNGSGAFFTYGNVGIGTTDPSEKLEISGDILASGVLQIGGASSGLAYHQFGSGTKDEAAIADAEDVYISGDLEVDGVIYGDGSGLTGVTTSATPGGSDGQVQYNNGGSMGGASNLFYNDSTNQVGIGTTVPYTMLDTTGAIRTTGSTATGSAAGAGLEIAYLGGTTGSRLFSYDRTGGTRLPMTYDAINHHFNINGAEKMTIDSNGNVGIGTTAPGARLEIVSASGSTLDLKSTGAYGYMRYLENSTIRGYMGFGDSGHLFTGGIANSMRLRSEGAIHFGTNGDHIVMTIDTNYNVGIGTTSPLQKLQVAGDINIESGSGIRINNTATAGQYLRGDGARFVSSAIQVGDLPTITAAGGWTDDGSIVRLTTVGDLVGIGYADPGTAKLAVNGNVGIGTTNPSNKVEIVGGLTVTNNWIDVTSYLGLRSDSGTVGIRAGASTGDILMDLGDYVAIRDRDDSYAEDFRFDTDGNSWLNSGNVGIGTTAPGTKLNVSGGALCVNGGGGGGCVNSTGYVTASGLYDYEANSYFVDPGSAGIAAAFSGNIGIGTTTPDAKLTIQAPAGGTGNLMESYKNSAGDTRFTFLYDGSNIRYSIANRSSSPLLTVAETSGYVGIGTTAPGARLHVDGTEAYTSTTPNFMVNDDADRTIGIWGNHISRTDYDDDSAALNINYLGYNGGTTRFRDFAVYDGKSNLVMKVDGSTGYVGIGTTNPSRQLEVINKTSSGNIVGKFVNESATSGVFSIVDIVQSGAANSKSLLRFATDNGGWMIGKDDARGEIFGIATGLFGDLRNTKFAIDSSGNIGIGTTSPTTILHSLTSGDASLQTNLRLQNPSGTAGTATGIQFVAASDMTGSGKGGIFFERTTSYGRGNLYLAVDNTADASNADLSDAKITIAANGNVGIGTTAPSAQLEINAPVATIGTNQIKLADGTTGGYFSVMEGSSGASLYLPMFTFASAGINGFGGLLLGGIPSASDVFDGTGGAVVIDGRRNPSGSLTASNILNIRNNGASKMVVDYTGNVGIGTTAPGGKLEVNGTIKFSSYGTGSYQLDWGGIYLQRNTGSNTVYSNGNLSNAGTLATGGSGGNYSNYICSSGSGSGTFGTCSSSREYKENINYFDTDDYERVLKEIQNINVASFTVKDEEDSFHHIGIIAEEAPSSVQYIDKNGNVNVDFMSIQTGYTWAGIKALANYADKIDEQVKDLSLSVATKSLETSSFDNLIYDLDEVGNIAIEDQGNENFVVKINEDKAPFEKIIAANVAFFADLKAGIIKAQKLIVDKIETKEIISPMISSDEIETKKIKLAEIAPLKDGDVEINLERDQENGFGSLIVKGEENETVASIDSSGNGSFSGKLTAKSVKSDSVETDTLTAKEASFSSVYVDNLISKEGSFGEIMTNKIASVREELEKLISGSSTDDGSETEATGTSLLSQAEDWDTDSATGSATISLDSTDLGEISLASTLIIQGQLSVEEAFINKGALIGNIAIGENSVSALSEILYLQPSGGKIDFLAGVMTVEDNGTVTINGNLSVTGSIAANEYRGSGGDFNINLAKNDPESGFGNLMIKGRKGNVVASIDASGSASFEKLNISADASASAIIAADSILGQLATTSAEIKTNASAGNGEILLGQTEVVIYSEKLTENSMVYITPTSDTKNQVLYVKNKNSQGKKYFTVAIGQALGEPITFSWWIIN